MVISLSCRKRRKSEEKEEVPEPKKKRLLVSDDEEKEEKVEKEVEKPKIESDSDSDDVEAALKEIDEEEKGLINEEEDDSNDSKKHEIKEVKEFSSSSDSEQQGKPSPIDSRLLISSLSTRQTKQPQSQCRSHRNATTIIATTTNIPGAIDDAANTSAGATNNQTGRLLQLRERGRRRVC